MSEPMSNERLTELLGRMKRHALSNTEAEELAAEVERLRTLNDELVSRSRMPHYGPTSFDHWES